MEAELSKRLAVVASAYSSDPREAVRRAHLAGFAGVLFDAYSRAFDFPGLSRSGQREFLSMIRRDEMCLVGLQGDLGRMGLGPDADIDRVLDRADAALRAAADLRSPLVCIDVGVLPEPARESKPPPTITTEQAGLIIIPRTPIEAAAEKSAPPNTDPAIASKYYAALTGLGHRAERYSCTIALSSSLASFAALDFAIRAAGCPWFGIDLDPVAMLRDQWPADEIFSRIGNRVRHVRVRDAILGADGRTKPAAAGDGQVDWPALMSRLGGSAYKGWLTIDPVELPDRATASLAGRNLLLAL